MLYPSTSVTPSGRSPGADTLVLNICASVPVSAL
jgi:hypothetical protein